KGVDQKKLEYIEEILKKFEHCWSQCKKVLQEETGGYLKSMIEDRERREGQTMEEAFNFEKQNVQLVRRFSVLKDEIRQGNQKAFQQQVLNTHDAIEKNSTIWT